MWLKKKVTVLQRWKNLDGKIRAHPSLHQNLEDKPARFSFIINWKHIGSTEKNPKKPTGRIPFAGSGMHQYPAMGQIFKTLQVATSSSYAVRSFISPSEASWDQNQQDFQAPWPPYIPQPARRKKRFWEKDLSAWYFQSKKTQAQSISIWFLPGNMACGLTTACCTACCNQVNGCQISGLPCLPSKNFPKDATNLKKSQESTDPGPGRKIWESNRPDVHCGWILLRQQHHLEHLDFHCGQHKSCA